MGMPEVTVLMTRTVSGVIVEAVQGDITSLEVDAIVNAANNHLWMGAGVAGAIKRRGGEGIEQEAVAKGPVPVGSAVETSAGALRARHVIHAAVMGQDLRTDLSTVARTTRAVLDLAGDLDDAVVAMPLLGTGVGGLDLEEVAATMVGEVASLARGGSCRFERVLVVAYDDAAAEAVRTAVGAL
jgi:O-acetyl-ADP-ribose deacetylase (regulator of RNase III)